MDEFTRDHLKELITYQDAPCVSIYLPTHRAGAEIQQDPIRFKNLLRRAEDALIQSGKNTGKAHDFFETARNKVLLNEVFWQHGDNGLAVFIGPDLLRYYRLPVDFEETALVNDRFTIKPLFNLFQEEGQFYILALSQNDVRLLKGSKYGVQELELANAPGSVDDARKPDRPKDERHPIARGSDRSTASQPGVRFVSHGIGEDNNRDDVLQFFRAIDRSVQDYLADENAPLVLAGVEYLIPLYRKATTYHYLADESIPGNPDELRDEELHARALEILEPDFKDPVTETVQVYRQLVGERTGLASQKIEEIVPAAYGGRVAQLFVRKDEEMMGYYDRAANQVTRRPGEAVQREDLLDIAARDTFLNGGAVYVLDGDQMPVPGWPVAAIFRY